MDRQLKICCIITRMNIGGPARLVIELLTLPVYTMLLSGTPDEREGKMSFGCLNTKSVPSMKRNTHIFNDLIAFWSIFWAIRKFKPDIVHTHMAKAGFLGRIAAWLARVPVRIHTFHGHTFYGYWGWIKSLLVRLVEHLLGYITTRIIAISPSQKEEIASYIGHRKKIVVIRNGFDLGRFDNSITKLEARKRLGWPIDRRIYGFVGRLAPVKNIDGFIRYAEKISDASRRSWFVVVGDGPEREKIPEWIYWEPWRQDIEVVYKALDKLVLMSKNEGTPTTILEAKVSGCSVTALRVGGVRDIIFLSKDEVLELYNPDRLRRDVMNLYQECLA